MTQSQHRVSVVIPVRDRATIVGRALESVARQTVPIEEVIVVDDGSTDDTVAAVRRYADRFPRFQLIENAVGGGAPKARNAGAAAATGTLIALLDSDDEWTPDKIERQLEILDEDVAAVFTNIRYRIPGQDDRLTAVAAEVRLEDLFYENFIGSCSTALIRKSAFDQVGGFDVDLPSCQDWELWLRLGQRGKLRVAPDLLTLYHLDAENRISRNVERVRAGHFVVFDRIRKMAQGHGIDDDLARFHRLLLAKTMLYSAQVPKAYIGATVENFVRPSRRSKRRSSIHMLMTAAKLHVGLRAG